MPSTRYPKRKRTEDDQDGRAANTTRKTTSKTHLEPTLDGERGKRLIPTIVDQLSSKAKDKVWIKFAQAGIHPAHSEDVTYGTLANAVNRTATWLQSNVGSGRDQVYAYIGPSDARYLLLIIAAAKVGCCMFLPSPHNGLEAQQYILQETKSVVLLHASAHAAEATEIAGGAGLEVRLVPSLADLLDDKRIAHVAYEEMYETAKGKPFVILHTSGTTGLPKPVTIPHGYYAYEDLSRTPQYTDGFDTITSAPSNAGTLCLVTSPLWHAGGMFFGLLKPLLNSVVAVLPPTGLPITANLIHSCLVSSGAGILQVAPSVAAELAAEPEYAATTSQLKYIIIGSGPMPQAAGNMLVKLNANTLHYFGATETDLLPLLRLDDPIADWQYHHFHPLSGASFNPIGDGLFELVIKRLEGVPQPCFEVFPDAQTYSTQDMFTKHPSKPDLWKYGGRLDDVIVFSTGEKMSPAVLEDAVTVLPGVSGALVVGQGRSRAALLVELDDSADPVETIEAIWFEVQEANDALPSFGRIAKPLISSARRPFERTPKGTVRRRETENSSEDQINELYRNHKAKVPGGLKLGTTTSETDVLAFVSSAHAAASDTEIHRDADIFMSAMDSMQVARMVHTLNNGLSKSHDPAVREVRLFAGHLYTHRSIAGITKALHTKIDQVKHADLRKSHKKHEAALQRHIGRLPRAPSTGIARRSLATPLSNVILTGSTGSLGTHLLHTLLRNGAVRHVHCLDRSYLAEGAYLDTFPMDAPLLLKVTFHQIKNLETPMFGLHHHIYRQLCVDVTTIIHNAWPVNFQLPLESSDAAHTGAETLDPHVGGIATLVDFAAEAEHHPRIVFISSLAAVLRHNASIPEAVVKDPSAPELNGYSRSKWMGEQLLGTAAETNAIRSPIIIRPGQIAGPLPHVKLVRGSGSTWDIKQTVPSLVLSSAAIGALPRSLGEKNKLRWIPVDTCAQVILDIAGEHEQPGAYATADVYNLTNLATAKNELTWTDDLLPLVRKRLVAASPKKEIEIVSLADWYDRMVAYGPKADNPAFKLLDFFQDLGASDEHAGLGAEVDVGKASAASGTFRNLGPVQVGWMEYWMKGWGL